jgi:hypothetical protein
MIHLTKALHAWGTAAFKQRLKEEIELLDAGLLPLQQGLSRGSYSNGKSLSVMIIGISDEPHLIRAKTGIFYTAIIAGCSCADDPTPVDELTEYCEVQFDIDKTTAEATVTLLS